MSSLHPPVGTQDHIQGKNTATITLTEYGDYQCPFCGRAYPIVKKLQKKFGSRLRFVFRNFPLQESHPDAYHAALAAEAAALQGKFWEMHDMLYENQPALDLESLSRYSGTLGLDLKRFRKDFESEKLQLRVDNDLETGLRSGVNGTPSFYINEEKYNGDWRFEPFSNVLSEMVGA
jgi:protein-disulfide isomerase